MVTADVFALTTRVDTHVATSTPRPTWVFCSTVIAPIVVCPLGDGPHLCGARRGRRPVADDPRVMTIEANRLPAFLLGLGRELCLAGAAVTETQQRLTRVAAANGAPDARIVVMPTTLMIAVGWAGETAIEAVPQQAGILRLDQIAVLYDVVHDAERGAVGPDEGLRRLAAMRRMRPRRGRLATIGWYAVMTAGLCLILQPTGLDVAIAAGF